VTGEGPEELARLDGPDSRGAVRAARRDEVALAREGDARGRPWGRRDREDAPVVDEREDDGAARARQDEDERGGQRELRAAAALGQGKTRTPGIFFAWATSASMRTATLGSSVWS
jgi:hypothetical protein